MKCPSNNRGCPYNVEGDCHCPNRNCDHRDGCEDKQKTK